MHPKLAKPTSQLRPSYQVVVIGSGYGGSIAASRLARAGQRVCLLEKGREIRPGEFPDRFDQAAPQMQMHTPQGRLGDDTGLYEVVVGQGISVVKGCGLGGTSLINANVSIEPEPRVFERPAWPTGIRQDLASVFEGMARARAMLKPTPYPAGQPNYPALPKTLAQQKSAAALGEKFAYLDINVNFTDQSQGNHVGVAQQPCNNCGDCCSGCNVSAKNTLPMNYLPDAVNHGAEIFCEVGVSHLERRGDKWLVFYQLLNVDREKFEAPLLFVEADLVFLGAGALGSTEILLRSGQRGSLDLSPMLGAQFTGNGDVLGFGYNNDEKINGVGFGDRTDVDPVGPCITSVIDARHKPVLEDGMVIEEGSIPGAVKPLLKPMLFTASRAQQGDTDEGWADWAAEKAREAESLVRGVYHGAINHTQTYLIMTHDDHNGRLSLDHNGRLALDWPGVGKQKIFAKANQNLQLATTALGGSFVHNPVWTEKLDFDLVTVHPLGGCIMADRAEAGVTDHKGQVFRGNTGTDLYPGLYVVDGAIIPCSLGTNPLLTISGLAERNVKLVAEAHGWQVGYDFPPRKAATAPPLNAGVMFTETMKGFFAVGETADYQDGLTKGRAGNSPLAFTLTIQVDDIDAFVDDPAHLAGMAGTVVAPHLSTKALTVSGGVFNLFVKDPAKPSQKYMEYRFQMHSVEGDTYFFSGFKDVRDDPGFDVWKDLTVLYVTLYQGPDAHAPVLGKGMLKIEVGDFATQLTTMKPLHAKGLRQKTVALLAFGRLFGGDVLDTYF
jgi:cholesterol oxidase